MTFYTIFTPLCTQHKSSSSSQKFCSLFRGLFRCFLGGLLRWLRLGLGGLLRWRLLGLLWRLGLLGCWLLGGGLLGLGGLLSGWLLWLFGGILLTDAERSRRPGALGLLERSALDAVPERDLDVRVGARLVYLEVGADVRQDLLAGRATPLLLRCDRLGNHLDVFRVSRRLLGLRRLLSLGRSL